MPPEPSTSGTERRGDLNRYAIDCALQAAWYTERWIPADPDYGFVDYFEAAVSRNLDLLEGFELLADDAAHRGILPPTEGDQATLLTDGGTTTDAPQVRVHCLDCDEIDMTLGLKAVGISSDGARDKTDETLEEMLKDELDCRACGGTVVIDEVTDT